MTDITSIAQLRPDQRNARKRTERSAGLIAKSLEKFGAARSIVIDEDGQILAGHGTVEAAAQLGIEKVVVVPADGHTVVAVQRTDLTPDQKTQYAIADNRSSDLSEWNAEVLAELSAEQSLDDWFSQNELADLLGQSQEDDDLADDQTDSLSETFSILIEFVDEFEQSAALETLTKQGFQCRALNS